MSEYFDPTVDNGAHDERTHVERTHDESRMGDALADHLLAEAAASLQSDTDADVLAEAAEILTAERVGLSLADRLAATSRPVTMMLRSGCRVEGIVERVGVHVVVLIDRDHARHCIAIASVVAVRGLRPALTASPNASPAGGGRPRIADLTWGMLLRDEPAAHVRIVFFDGSALTGLPALAGADHVDILEADGGVTTCALASVSRAVRQG